MLKKISTIVSLLRPHQWLKNLLILFPPFFARKMADPTVLAASVPALVSFCLAASSVYIINDVLDRELDRHHPVKRKRAIASGNLSVAAALVIAIGIGLVSLVLAAVVSRAFEAYLILYMIMTFLYSVYFKHVLILDMFIVSFGFLVRVLAGGEAFHVAVSSWLFLTVFVVALFISTGKRLSESILLGDDARKHRHSLARYAPAFLDGMMWSTAAVAIVMYALYTLEHGGRLFYTVPLITYGMLRYIHAVKNGSGDPTDVLLKDGHILSVGVFWVVMIGMILYTSK